MEKIFNPIVRAEIKREKVFDPSSTFRKIPFEQFLIEFIEIESEKREIYDSIMEFYSSYDIVSSTDNPNVIWVRKK